MAIKVFGDVDKNKDGKNASEFPAWYFRAQKEELENDIARNRTALERGYVTADRVDQIKKILKQDEEKLDQINESIPKLKEPEKDNLNKVVHAIGKDITSAMFTGTEMKKGTADAYEEARRITEPVIEVRNEKEADWYKSCGIEIKDGKVSRGEAEKVWKIGRRLLGEISNTEVLRRQ